MRKHTKAYVKPALSPTYSHHVHVVLRQTKSDSYNYGRSINMCTPICQTPQGKSTRNINIYSCNPIHTTATFARSSSLSIPYRLRCVRRENFFESDCEPLSWSPDRSTRQSRFWSLWSDPCSAAALQWPALKCLSPPPNSFCRVPARLPQSQVSLESW